MPRIASNPRDPIMPTLHWSGKEEAVKAARDLPYRPLVAVSTLDHGDPAADNLLIQVDNLDALKSLLPVYAGRIKCIFIDPLYKTRSAFEHYGSSGGKPRPRQGNYGRRRRLSKFISRRLKMPGIATSAVEVTHISRQGFWLLLDDEEPALPFTEFPWFKSATIEQLLNVERPTKNHLYWPVLDIDLSVDSIRDPERFPLVCKTSS